LLYSGVPRIYSQGQQGSRELAWERHQWGRTWKWRIPRLQRRGGEIGEEAPRKAADPSQVRQGRLQEELRKLGCVREFTVHYTLTACPCWIHAVRRAPSPLLAPLDATFPVRSALAAESHLLSRLKVTHAAACIFSSPWFLQSLKGVRSTIERAVAQREHRLMGRAHTAIHGAPLTAQRPGPSSSFIKDTLAPSPAGTLLRIPL